MESEEKEEKSKIEKNFSEQKVENNCSVKFSVNAKGLFSGECKAYAPSVEEAYARAKLKALEMEEFIRQKNV